LEAELNEEERERAARFRFATDRKRFIVAHGALRVLLARYIDLRPRDVCFEVGAFGKPRLASGINPVGLCFNISHSGDWAIVAAAKRREVGVDLERIDPKRADGAIVARFFAADERSALGLLSGDAWREGFFRCWTRKEAYLKAVGDGLHRPLESFSVSLSPREPAKLKRLQDSPSCEISRWEMLDVDGPRGYAAALVVDGAVGTLYRRQWSPRLIPDRGREIEAGCRGGS
jgi:4'-phosphopantetheinyl transferase